MRYYELSYIASSKLNEEELKSLQERIILKLKNEGGILDEETPPLKRTLAYPIKKETEAFLVSLSFFLNGEKIEKIKKELEKEKEILRYLLFQKKAPKEKLEKEKIKKPEKPKKVDLEELEEKLEEILGEKK